MSANHPLDTVANCSNIEVHEQSKSKARELQIREQLCLKNRIHLLDRLDLDNQLVSYEQIKTQSGVEFDSVVDDRKHNLPLDREACLL